MPPTLTLHWHSPNTVIYSYHELWLITFLTCWKNVLQLLQQIWFSKLALFFVSFHLLPCIELKLVWQHSPCKIEVRCRKVVQFWRIIIIKKMSSVLVAVPTRNHFSKNSAPPFFSLISPQMSTHFPMPPSPLLKQRVGNSNLVIRRGVWSIFL